MSDSTQFINTVKQLMRLTREGKIEWEEKSPEHPNGPPSFKGTFEDLQITLREDPSAGTSAIDFAAGQTNLDDMLSVRYVLEIHDQSDGSTVMSPPMKAVTDLVHVIQSQASDEKLSEINRRLGAT